MAAWSRLVLAAALLVAAFALSPEPQSAEAVLPVIAPTTGWVTQEFGGCQTDGQCHAALDIAGPPTLPGNPVYSMADGVVIRRIQQSNGYGCHIVIDHGNHGNGEHVYSLYSHLGRKDAQGVTTECYFSVGLNQAVGRGQQIGYQGNSGLATGTHVHFAVFVYPPPWSGSHHAIDPRQCIGFADFYNAGSPGVGCGPGSCPHDLADGCILHAVPSGRQFVFHGGAGFHIPNEATRASLFGSRPSWDVSDHYANSLQGRTPRDGTLLHDTSNGRQYVIVKGAKFHIPDEATLKSLYCPSYPQVRCAGDLWAGAVNSINGTLPDETVLNDASDGRVYVLIGGAKFHIPDPDTLFDLYCQTSQSPCVNTLWHAAIAAIPTTPRNGTIVHDPSTGAVHVVFGGARFHVPNEPILKDLYCPTYPAPGCWRNLWHAAAENIPTTPTDDTILREHPDPRVYAMCSGARWWIPSETVFNHHGYRPDKIGLLWVGALFFPVTGNTDTQVASPGDKTCDSADIDDDDDTTHDSDELRLFTTNPLHPDSDADGVLDPTDNCPRWPNPAQNRPAWPVIPIDADCDGFTSVAEVRIGTSAAQQCALTTAPNDEATDAWPVDLNDDRRVDGADLNLLKTGYNKSAGEAGYNPRFDLDGDQRVDAADLAILAGFHNNTCS